jgi:hypothetical protein
LPYCPAPALCRTCYQKHGPAKVLHASCVEGATSMQAREDEKQRKLDAGMHMLFVAYGDWHDAVPKDEVGAGFRGKDGNEIYVLVPSNLWNQPETLEELTEHRIWAGPHDSHRTKQVHLAKGGA